MLVIVNIEYVGGNREAVLQVHPHVSWHWLVGLALGKLNVNPVDYAVTPWVVFPTATGKCCVECSIVMVQVYQQGEHEALLLSANRFNIPDFCQVVEHLGDMLQPQVNQMNVGRETTHHVEELLLLFYEFFLLLTFV